MADTFTTNLNLTKPEVGASDDSWGTKLNADLDTIDGLFDTGPVLKVAKGGTGAATAAGARTALGLGDAATGDIGTDVQAYDATLTSLAALGTAADKLAYTTGVDTWAETGITSFGRSLIDDADAAAARTTLELGNAATGTIGTDVQAYDALLADIAGMTLTSGDILYADGAASLAQLAKGSAGQVLTMNTGATAPEWAAVIGAAAWVNFNGTGTVAINASYNVSSITDNGAGDYTVNFTNALADGNYAVVGSTVSQTENSEGGNISIKSTNNTSAPTTMSATAVRIMRRGTFNETRSDGTVISVAVFR